MSSERTRDDAGRYVSEVSVGDVLGVFDTVDGPTITTTDVVDALGCSRAVARSRLSTLAERGLVERRKSGQVVLWWRVDSGESAYLQGFGALADTDVPEGMRAERQRARAEWGEDGDDLS
ncbi:helix-turn-helix domain-containing protein [Halolamina sp. CBA1230]|uniref:helix-turn-helix domain-containing protein n=1 Tax=Halolamina sp. CBA1230 TaxID=1853690 RepID=UPI0009A1EC2B|nr:helix-turn-helix domain-containing protein [Halolamina sp. CBA1230]QKY18899.1 helix-turn-helix domain-containing protein [Halolamina sp. CBA1230]